MKNTNEVFEQSEMSDMFIAINFNSQSKPILGELKKFFKSIFN